MILIFDELSELGRTVNLIVEWAFLPVALPLELHNGELGFFIQF